MVHLQGVQDGEGTPQTGVGAVQGVVVGGEEQVETGLLEFYGELVGGGEAGESGVTAAASSQRGLEVHHRVVSGLDGGGYQGIVA